MTDWNDYHYFLRVASCGSLKASARELGVNHSTVFRWLNELETKLNVRLFERFKTCYQLTHAGEEILEKVRRIEEQMFAIERVVQGRDAELSGTLKISTTDTLGFFWLMPFIEQFKELYPEITINSDINTRYTDMSRLFLLRQSTRSPQNLTS